MVIKAVFGLGNPGRPYALTRHNIGFEVVDLYRKMHEAGMKGRIEGSALVYSIGDLLLVKPMTYMNESGVAVRAVLDKHRVPPCDAIIVYDDLDLALGRIRILAAGGAGSHNGMKSVIRALGTEDIPRLRIGIETEARGESGHDFVLDRFSKNEWKVVLPALQSAVEAIDVFCGRGIDEAMTRFNRWE
ncbi:MAG: aminoacyl-tRNA hydrolase [Candidatus Atribacteria bacterium]|nr:MAG: aminoacyl-tRNA hydrolase [Candidatus Atribacteria bacterium]